LLWAGTVLLGVAIAILNVLLPSIIKRDFPTRIGPITGAYTAVRFGVAALAARFAVPLAGQGSSGWRMFLGIWAGLALIAVGVFAPQLRTRPRDPSPSPTAPRRSRAPWTSSHRVRGPSGP
jgi:cyanate permease